MGVKREAWSGRPRWHPCQLMEAAAPGWALSPSLGSAHLHVSLSSSPCRRLTHPTDDGTGTYCCCWDHEIDARRASRGPAWQAARRCGRGGCDRLSVAQQQHRAKNRHSRPNPQIAAGWQACQTSHAALHALCSARPLPPPPPWSIPRALSLHCFGRGGDSLRGDVSLEIQGGFISAAADAPRPQSQWAGATAPMGGTTACTSGKGPSPHLHASRGPDAHSTVCAAWLGARWGGVSLRGAASAGTQGGRTRRERAPSTGLVGASPTPGRVGDGKEGAPQTQAQDPDAPTGTPRNRAHGAGARTGSRGRDRRSALPVCAHGGGGDTQDASCRGPSLPQRRAGPEVAVPACSLQVLQVA